MDINILFSNFETTITTLGNDRSALVASQAKLAAAQVDVATKGDAVTADIPAVQAAGAELIAGIQAQIDAAVAPPATPVTTPAAPVSPAATPAV